MLYKKHGKIEKIKCIYAKQSKISPTPKNKSLVRVSISQTLRLGQIIRAHTRQYLGIRPQGEHTHWKNPGNGQKKSLKDFKFEDFSRISKFTHWHFFNMIGLICYRKSKCQAIFELTRLEWKLYTYKNTQIKKFYGATLLKIFNLSIEYRFHHFKITIFLCIYS